MKAPSLILFLPLCLLLAGCAAHEAAQPGHMPVPTAEEAPEGSWRAAVEDYIAECRALEEERMGFDWFLGQAREMDMLRSSELEGTRLGRELMLWRQRYLQGLIEEPGPLEGGWQPVDADMDYVLIFHGRAFVEFHSLEDIRYGTYATEGPTVTLRGMRDILSCSREHLRAARPPETYLGSFSWHFEDGNLVLVPAGAPDAARTHMPLPMD